MPFRRPSLTQIGCIRHHRFLGVKSTYNLAHNPNTDYCNSMNWTTGKEVWLTPEAPEYLRPLNMWGPPDGRLWICGAPYPPGGQCYCNNPLLRSCIVLTILCLLVIMICLVVDFFYLILWVQHHQKYALYDLIVQNIKKSIFWKLHVYTGIVKFSWHSDITTSSYHSFGVFSDAERFFFYFLRSS